MRHQLLIARLAIGLGLALSACQGAPDTSVEEQPGKVAVAAQPKKGVGAKGVGTKEAAAERVRVPLVGAKIRGSERALVTIVEMSDYACPFCRKAHGTIEQVLAAYGEDVRVAVFENPLPFHTTAKPAATWAFAAGEQGKFWEARAALFENQKRLDEEGLAGLAKELGLDAERMERDRRSVGADRHVRAGLELAAAVGAKGTPTFFVNGRRVVGAQPLGAFKGIVDEALAEARALVASGVRREEVYTRVLESIPAQGAKAAAPGAAADDGAPCGGEAGDCAGCNGGCNGGDDCAGGCEGAERGCKGEPAAEAEDAAPVDVELGAAPVRGAASAPVTLVVFTDFECPFCAKIEGTVAALEKAYPGKLRVAYKAAPLPFHAHARLAAKAAVAAHRQGKFFEYRDALFAHQDKLDRAGLMATAGSLGLDVPLFEADLDSGDTESAVAADVAQMAKLGVKGTPTFFVNGRRIVGAQQEGAFRAAIDRALASR